MVQLVNNNPQDTNYHSTSETYAQLLQGQKSLTLNADNVSSVNSDAKLFNYGFGMIQLNGFAEVSSGSPTANLELASLPVSLNPTQIYRHPVCVLRGGVGVSNFIAVTPRGSSVASVSVLTPGSYIDIPTATVSGKGTGAVLAAPIMKVVAASVFVGGSAYSVGNVLTLSGGTASTAATLTVTSVSSGAITGVSITNVGSYSVLPSNPVSVTGGDGTAASFTIAWGVLSVAVTSGGFALEAKQEFHFHLASLQLLRFYLKS
jgi:hypothetical protein